MMKLYWSPRSRSFSALWLMEETGQQYERVLTDISKGAQKTIEYLAVNPMGKVPALQDGEATLAESAAICAYVAERYPEARLAPPLGDPLRAKYLYWLFFGPGCVEPAMVQVATKIEMNPVAAGWGDAVRVYDVLDAALEALDNGKPLRDARTVDVPGSYEMFRYMSGWATKNGGSTTPRDAKWASVCRWPTS